MRPSALWTLRLVVERFRLAVIVLVPTFPDGRAGSRLPKATIVSGYHARTLVGSLPRSSRPMAALLAE